MFPGWSIVATLAAFAVLSAVFLVVGAILRKVLSSSHPLREKLGSKGLVFAAAWTVRNLQRLLVIFLVGGAVLLTILYS